MTVIKMIYSRTFSCYNRIIILDQESEKLWNICNGIVCMITNAYGTRLRIHT